MQHENLVKLKHPFHGPLFGGACGLGSWTPTRSPLVRGPIPKLMRLIPKIPDPQPDRPVAGEGSLSSRTNVLFRHRAFNILVLQGLRVLIKYAAAPLRRTAGHGERCVFTTQKLQRRSAPRWAKACAAACDVRMWLAQRPKRPAPRRRSLGLYNRGQQESGVGPSGDL